MAIRRTVFPLLLMLLTPPLLFVVWYTHVELGGSLERLVALVKERGLLGTLAEMWGPVLLGSPAAWAILGLFVLIQILFLRFLPGRRVEGPMTASGHVPVYRANAPLAYLLTLALFCGASFGLGLFPASILYHRFGELLGALNVVALAACVLLYAKGRSAPSPGEHGRTGNPVFDFFWGIELYPRVLGVDVKQLTNCRLGMMMWPLFLISFAAAQYELHGFVTDAMLVAVGLMLVKTTKFFTWEVGYLRSMDIMHDRAGFYIVWGVLAFLPALYPAVALYLVHHPHELGLPLALGITALGLGAHAANHIADVQRKRVRETAGACRVFFRRPEVIVARYRTRDGEPKQSLLLASGFWGIARHFHYVPEIVLSICWTLPVGFGHALPWLYVVYITILLVHRAHRDDQRCAAKYGEDWDAYRARVPWKLVPGVH